MPAVKEFWKRLKCSKVIAYETKSAYIFLLELQWLKSPKYLQTLAEPVGNQDTPH